MHCRDFVAGLDAWRSGELDLASRLGMHLHAAICRACSAYWESYERTSRLVTWAYLDDLERPGRGHSRSRGVSGPAD